MIRLILFTALAGAVFAVVRHLLRGARVLLSRHDQQDALQQEQQARHDAVIEAPGGSAENPIIITSPSIVEPRAQSLRCPQCDGPCLVDQHTVESHDGVSLRVAHLVCQRCAAERTVFFQLRPKLLN